MKRMKSEIAIIKSFVLSEGDDVCELAGGFPNGAHHHMVVDMSYFAIEHLLFFDIPQTFHVEANFLVVLRGRFNCNGFLLHAMTYDY